jgi:lambda family phage holin
MRRREMDDGGGLHRTPELTTVGLGAAAAFCVAVLRGLYDGDEPKLTRVLLEASVCSGLSVSAVAALFWFCPALASSADLAATVGSGAGAFIGFLGVNFLRKILMRFLNKRIK